MPCNCGTTIICSREGAAMKREGDIGIIKNIEHIITSKCKYTRIKARPMSIAPIQGADTASAVETKIYEVYSGAFVFVIKLQYDYRVDRGRVAIADNMLWRLEHGSEAWQMGEDVADILQYVRLLIPMSGDWKRTLNETQGAHNHV